MEEHLDTLIRGLKDCPADHPFLTGMGLHGTSCKYYEGDAEISGVPISGCIAAPIKDINGVLMNLYCKRHFDGEKRSTEDLTVPGAPTAGGFIRVGGASETVLITEDYLCGLALHQSTGLGVAVALYSANIEPVAMALRAKFPEGKLVVCGSDHSDTDGATNADLFNSVAKKVGALVAFPKDSKTFYQMLQLQGEALVEEIANAPTEPEDVFDYSNGLDESGIPAATPTCSAPINGDSLLDSIVDTLNRYVSLQDGAAIAIALWIIFTHTIHVARVSPILAVLSPVRRCGKTTLLGLLMRLVYRPMASSNLTPAVLFRTIHAWSPTLLIDEADTHLSKSVELNGVLNSGHTRDTAFVQRIGKGGMPKRFNTFSAKAIAMIGTLPETLIDRSIAIHQQRKHKDDVKSKLRQGKNVEIDLLSARITRWAADNAHKIEGIEFEQPQLGNDRASDNWEPMLAVAMAISPGCFETASEAAAMLSRSQAGLDCNGEDLLRDVQATFDRTKAKRLSTAQLIGALCADEESPWTTADSGRPISPRALATMLAPFEIKSKNLRVSNQEVIKGYERVQFEDAFARYVTALRK